MLRRPASTLALLAVCATAVPAQADTSFLDRFEGRYGGTGSVQREEDTSPRRVSCSVNGTRPAETALRIAGSCRAAVIVRREIGADIRYDAGRDRFGGTYTGSTKGAARLSNGRLRGDTLTFTLTYPVVVHGDRTATMTIRNTGSGTFTLVVTDRIEGATRETSSITLTRS